MIAVVVVVVQASTYTMYVARGESEPAVMQTMGGKETPVTVFSQVLHTHTRLRHIHKAEKEKGTGLQPPTKVAF